MDITNKLIDKITLFLQEGLAKRGFKKAILGLSGGIDSATSLALCKRANIDIKAVMMPSSTSSKDSLEHANLICEKFSINYEIASISNFDDCFRQTYKNASVTSRGNFCSRLRMATLYFKSFEESRLVVGASNKSELMLGYGTIYGDLAYGINPIGSFFKSDIFKLAKALEIPNEIINKKPSADLYPNQSDEEDIGYSYERIDSFLKDYEKYGNDASKLLESHSKDLVESLLNRINKNKFKQELGEIFIP